MHAPYEDGLEALAELVQICSFDALPPQDLLNGMLATEVSTESVIAHKTRKSVLQCVFHSSTHACGPCHCMNIIITTNATLPQEQSQCLRLLTVAVTGVSDIGPLKRGQTLRSIACPTVLL